MTIWSRVFLIVFSVVITGGFFWATSTIAHAGTIFNQQINYQGRLMTPSNVAVASGNYSVRFKLYTTPTGGSPLWSEVDCYSPDNGVTCNGTGVDRRIPLANGVFSVLLGSTTPITGVDFNQVLYLGVEVGGSSGTASWDGEMTPRKMLGAVPASMYAGTSTVAKTLNGVSDSQFVRNDIQNSTSSATTFLSILQSGAGKVAEFFGQAAASVLSILSNGNVGVGSSTPSATLTVVGTSSAGVNPFVVASSTGTSMLTILQNGNVGIGTSTPTNPLTVIETAAGGPIVYGATGINSGNADVNVYNSSGTSKWSVAAVSLLTTTNPGFSLYDALNNKFPFQIESNSASGSFYIRNNGSVGIGTTSPTAKLEVAGNTYVGGTITATGAAAFGGTLNSAGTAALGTGSANYISIAGSATSPSLSVLGSSADADLTLTPKGNGQVMIGGGGYTYTTAASGKGSILFSNGTTDSPNMKFVYGNNVNISLDTAPYGAFGGLQTQFLRFIKNSDESGGAVEAGIDAAGNAAFVGTGYFGGTLTAIATTTTAGLKISTLGNSFLAVDASGNVIATTTPTGTGTNYFSNSGATTTLTTGSNLAASLGVFGSIQSTSTAISSFAGATTFMGNVGIGTAATANTLEVTGTGYISGQSILAGAYRFYTGGTDGSTAYTDFRTNPATGNGIISAKTNALFFNFDHGTGGTFWANGSGQSYAYMSQTGQLTLNNNGILSGVNIPSIRNTLDVGGGAVIGSSYANVNTAPTNGLLVQGNIGIGTTTAGSALTVAGDGWFNGNITTGNLIATSTLYIGTTTDSWNPTMPGKLTLDMGTGNTSENAVDAHGTVNDFLQFNITNHSKGVNAQSGYAATADTGTLTSGFMWMGINNSGYSTTTAYNVGGALDSNILSSSNDLYIAQAISGKKTHFLNGGVSTSTNEVMTFSGNNIGIGTTTPSQKLDVAGNIALGSRVDGYGRIFLNQMVARALPTTVMVGADDGSTNELNFGGGTTGGYIAKNIKFHTASNDTTSGSNVQMSINGAGLVNITQNLTVSGIGNSSFVGNVGIGTSTPGQQLTVGNNNQFTVTSTGNVSATGYYYSSSASNGNKWVTNSAGPTYMGILGSSINANTNSTISFGYSSGPALAINPVLTVVDNGKVGIGSTTPSAKLTIHDNSGLASTNPLFIIASSTAAGTATSTLFTIFGNGRVGIGSSTPNYLLSVNGSVNFTGLSTSAVTGLAGVVCLDGTNQLVKMTGGTCVVSSARYKNSITSLTEQSGLAEVMQFNPVSFTYNADPSNAGTQLGFIAEQMQTVDPRLVFLDENGLPNGVRYENMTAVLAKAIQQQQRAIISLQNATTTIDFAGIASTTSTTLASSTTFVGTIAQAVKDLISSTGNWVVNQFTATLATFGRVQTQTAAVTNGLEMTDSATGQTYCVRITNGDWQKVSGSCATPATGSTPVTPSQSPISTTGTPQPAPVTDATFATTTSSATSPDVTTPNLATSTVPVATSSVTTTTSVVEIAPPVSTATPAPIDPVVPTTDIQPDSTPPPAPVAETVAPAPAATTDPVSPPATP